VAVKTEARYGKTIVSPITGAVSVEAIHTTALEAVTFATPL